jgi:translation elongation factor EF-Tu-like GTPase
MYHNTLEYAEAVDNVCCLLRVMTRRTSSAAVLAHEVIHPLTKFVARSTSVKKRAAVTPSSTLSPAV